LLPERWQFSIRSLLWLTFITALFLGYVRLMDPRGWPVLVLMPLVAAVTGMGFGSFTGRRQDGAYWAAVGTALGVVCVTSARVSELTMWYWPLLGAVAGGYAGAYRPAFRWRTVAVAAGLGVGLFFAFFGPFKVDEDELLVDLICTPFASAGLVGLVSLIEWLRVRYHTPRDLWAAGLIAAVIAGNLAALAVGRGRWF
jgi:hypothetical protein